MGGIIRSIVQGLLRDRAQGSSKKPALSAVLLSAAALGGCAIHPVQQDVTGVPPKVIVDRIRCEARLAVIDKAIDLLRHAADDYRGTKPALADRFDDLVLYLKSQRGKNIRIDPRSLPTEHAKAFYSRYINTVIAYDFLMQGVENNRVALVADPVRLITNGTAGIIFGGSSELMRDNQRHLAISDTFGDLLFDEKMRCDPDYLPENFLYPISGRVGLSEVVDTFIELNEDKPLSEIDTKAKTVFADTLKFTTTLSGSATPHVQIDPIGNQLGLASPTNVALSASRSDIHTLTIGLAMGPPQYVPLSGIPGLPLAAGPPAYRTQQSNKAAAFQAIQDLRIRSFLDRAVVR